MFKLLKCSLWRSIGGTWGWCFSFSPNSYSYRGLHGLLLQVYGWGFAECLDSFLGGNRFLQCNCNDANVWFRVCCCFASASRPCDYGVIANPYSISIQHLDSWRRVKSTYWHTTHSACIIYPVKLAFISILFFYYFCLCFLPCPETSISYIT